MICWAARPAVDDSRSVEPQHLDGTVSRNGAVVVRQHQQAISGLLRISGIARHRVLCIVVAMPILGDDRWDITDKDLLHCQANT